MNGAHIHLLLNHIPVIGMILTLPLLAWGIWRRSDDLMRASLWLLVVIGIISVAVYFSGEPAEEVIEEMGGISESLIEPHEESALIAAILIVLTSITAAFALFRFRRGPLSRRLSSVLFLLALVSAGVVSYTANLGGRIRHSEIRGDAAEAETEVTMSDAGTAAAGP